MFKQVFSRFFKKTTNNLLPSEQYNGQAQIYAIPTISSNFENQRTHASTSKDFSFSSASIPMSTSNGNFSKLDYYAKYDDNNTRQIYIAPHCIRYSNSTLDDTVYRIDDESLNEIAAEILESENLPPKLQIVFYDENYFAINNSHLQIYKQLQLSGLITHVQADLISVEAIPYPLREYLLQTPSHLLTNFTSEMTDEDYHEANTDDLSSSSRSNETNQSSTCSGINESLNGSEFNVHDECSFTPDVVFAEDVYDDNIYVDEIYEFGACENCLDSGDEDNTCTDRKHEQNVSPLAINESADKNGKLNVYLKTKASHSNDTTEKELNDIVKSVLKSEQTDQNEFKNLDKKCDESNISNEFRLLKLDLAQKKLNEEMSSQARIFTNEDENQKFIVKQSSRLSTSKNKVTKKCTPKEIENLLVTNEDDEY